MTITEHISASPWTFFVTLTFGTKSPDGNRLEVPGAAVRSRMLFQWLRQASKLFGISLYQFRFVAREEQGELGGRWHFHVLAHVPTGKASNLPGPWANRRSACYALENLWRNRCGKSGGIGDVRSYEAGHSTAAYITKGVDLGEKSLLGANTFENRRFVDDGDCVWVNGLPVVRLGRQLILAPSFVRDLAAKSRYRRHLSARELKKVSRDRSTTGTRSGSVFPSSLRHPYAPGPGQGLL